MSITNTRELNSMVSNTYLSRVKEVSRDNPNYEDKDTVNFNSMSDQQRDTYNPVSYNTMVKYCYRLWLDNPMAYSAIEIMIDFTLGDMGIKYKAKDDKVQEVLDEFMKINCMEKNGKKRLRDKLINGELCLTANTSKYSGRVKLGWKDPKLISQLDIDPVDNEEVLSITFNNDLDKKHEVIRMNPVTGKYEGDIFYYQINKVGGQTRGLSDLFQSRDWLVKYDSVLDGIQKYLEALTKIIWDIKIEGAEEDELRQRNTDLKKAPPQKQSWVLHNETEEWKLNTPNTQGGNFNAIDNIFKGAGITGLRMPIHFFGRGDDANRATAMSMNSPFYRKIKSKQSDEIIMYKEIGQFVIDTAKTAGVIDKNIDDSFTVKLPEPDKELLVKMSGVLSQIADAITTMKIEGHISENTAKSLSDMMINHLGVDIPENDNPATTAGELNVMNSKIMNLMSQAMKRLEKSKKDNSEQN